MVMRFLLLQKKVKNSHFALKNSMGEIGNQSVVFGAEEARAIVWRYSLFDP
jgi:hypothetical protein